MKHKQQGALHLLVLVAILAVMIGAAFMLIFFLDRAALNRMQSERQVSARESEPQVRPMTVDNPVEKDPLDINQALERLKQPLLDDEKAPEESGSAQPTVDDILTPEQPSDSTATAQ